MRTNNLKKCMTAPQNNSNTLNCKKNHVPNDVPNNSHYRFAVIEKEIISVRRAPGGLFCRQSNSKTYLDYQEKRTMRDKTIKRVMEPISTSS